MSFKTILCPLDFSEGSGHALRVASRLANESNAELVLVHVWYVPPVTDAGESMLPPDVVKQMTGDVRRGLEAAVGDATALGVKRVKSDLLTGAPWQAIVDDAKQRAADLIVIGTHGRTGLSRIWLGSVAEQVVRHAPCSVLAVRVEGEAKPFTHALCPIDFSESSQDALDLASQLLGPSGKATLLHVIDMPIAFGAEAPLVNYEPDLRKQSEATLATWSARAAGKLSVVTTQARFGRPIAQTIEMIDEDPSIDLVVMGSHGRTGLKRALLGSVAEKVVRHARCPVLVARTKHAK